MFMCGKYKRKSFDDVLNNDNSYCKTISNLLVFRVKMKFFLNFCQVKMSDHCKHIMISGKNKGKPCNEYSTTKNSRNTTYSMKLNFCDKHSESHRAEWEPIFLENEVKHKEMLTKKRQNFESKLEPREINYKNMKTLFVMSDIPDFLTKRQETTENVVEVVDRIIKDDLVKAYHILKWDTTSVCRFNTYVSQWSKFSMKEIIDEFVIRGFSTLVDTPEICIRVEYVHLR
jgi:hypothetical protein